MFTRLPPPGNNQNCVNGATNSSNQLPYTAYRITTTREEINSIASVVTPSREDASKQLGNLNFSMLKIQRQTLALKTLCKEIIDSSNVKDK